jgi:putative Holliday junction resolvase
MNSPLLALDIGLKRTGVALSESGLIAQPLGVIEWQLPHANNLVKPIIDYIRQYEIRTLVVGVPFDQDEQLTSQALKTEHIIVQLEDELKKEKLDTVVVRVNEFSSTQDGLAAYPGVDKDAAAATLLLQDYLEQNGGAW